MYASGLLYLVGMPLALGSYWGLLALVFMVPVLIWRLVDEEKFLAKHLPGVHGIPEKNPASSGALRLVMALPA
jgi:hypothetical protein